MNRQARCWHAGMVGNHLALLVLLLLWLTWLKPPPPPLVAPALLLLAGPLLLPLRGLLHGRRYTSAWTSLLALFYFAHGVAATATGDIGLVLGVAEIIISTALFTCCLLYIRSTRPVSG